MYCISGWGLLAPPAPPHTLVSIVIRSDNGPHLMILFPLYTSYVYYNTYSFKLGLFYREFGFLILVIVKWSNIRVFGPFINQDNVTSTHLNFYKDSIFSRTDIFFVFSFWKLDSFTLLIVVCKLNLTRCRYKPTVQGIFIKSEV